MDIQSQKKDLTNYKNSMKRNWIVVYSELGHLDEDMFQAEYWEFVLDIGYYWDGYLKLQVIRNYDWEKPIEKVSFLDITLIEPFVELFKWRIVNGFYPSNWEFDPNKWLEKES